MQAIPNRIRTLSFDLVELECIEIGTTKIKENKFKSRGYLSERRDKHINRRLSRGEIRGQRVHFTTENMVYSAGFLFFQKFYVI